MNVEAEPTQLSIDRFHLAVRLTSIFFPFSADDIRPVLVEMGYELNPQAERRRLPSAAPGVRIEIVGTIASKSEGSMSVRIDADRAILAIDGTEVEPVLDDFRRIEQWIQENLALNLERENRFYEYTLTGDLQVGAAHSPVETIARLEPDSRDMYSRFSKRIGTQVTNFGVRLVRTGESPGQDEWLEIRIEPSVQRSHTTYYVNVIHRSHDRRSVIEEAPRIPDLVVGIVADMEEE